MFMCMGISWCTCASQCKAPGIWFSSNTMWVPKIKLRMSWQQKPLWPTPLPAGPSKWPQTVVFPRLLSVCLHIFALHHQRSCSHYCHFSHSLIHCMKAYLEIWRFSSFEIYVVPQQKDKSVRSLSGSVPSWEQKLLERTKAYTKTPESLLTDWSFHFPNHRLGRFRSKDVKVIFIQQMYDCCLSSLLMNKLVLSRSFWALADWFNSAVLDQMPLQPAWFKVDSLSFCLNYSAWPHTNVGHMF